MRGIVHRLTKNEDDRTPHARPDGGTLSVKHRVDFLVVQFLDQDIEIVAVFQIVQ